MSLNKSQQSLPYFQQLQQQLTAHIRNPKQNSYNPKDETAIEPRRLKIYEELFFNNLHDFFSQLFPVCKTVLGEQRWAELIREYLIKHQSQTPLFHELAGEFLDFMHNEFTPLENDPDFLMELAHYEWVELALTVSEESGFVINEDNKPQSPIDLDTRYQLSPLAWPLAYEWPVHKISKDFQPTEKPIEVTTLLMYRSAESSHAQNTPQREKVCFMEMSPLLYQWINQLENFTTAKKALIEVTQQTQMDESALIGFAQQSLAEFEQLGIVRQS